MAEQASFCIDFNTASLITCSSINGKIMALQSVLRSLSSYAFV
jgi:hypothetical protein